MILRSRSLLAVSLALLAAATGLGTLLMLDGEVGTDEARLVHAAPGDELRLKGTLAPHDVPAGPDPDATAWSDVREVVSRHTYVLSLDAPGAGDVLVTSETALDTERVLVIDAAVLWAGAHPVEEDHPLVVVQALDAAEPLLFR